MAVFCCSLFVSHVCFDVWVIGCMVLFLGSQMYRHCSHSLSETLLNFEDANSYISFVHRHTQPTYTHNTRVYSCNECET